MEMSTKCDWLGLKMAIITIKLHMSAAAFVPGCISKLTSDPWARTGGRENVMLWKKCRFSMDLSLD